MANKKNRYKEMERRMTYAILADFLLFILYLIAAGNDIIWLKVVLSLFAIVLSGGCLAFLYLSRELTRPRSLWMTAAAGAILVCVLFSLILNFPSPAPV